MPKRQNNEILNSGKIPNPKFQIQNNIKILMTKIGKLVLKIGIWNLEFVLDFGFPSVLDFGFWIWNLSICGLPNS
jgi:hypothetical protein